MPTFKWGVGDLANQRIKASNAYGTTDSLLVIDTFLCIVIDKYMAQPLCIDLYELTINQPCLEHSTIFDLKCFFSGVSPKAQRKLRCLNIRTQCP